MKELVEKINALYVEFEKDATAQADKGVKAAGQRARKVSLALEKELKNFRRVSLEATK